MVNGVVTFTSNLAPVTNILNVTYSGDIHFAATQVSGSITLPGQSTTISITPPASSRPYSENTAFTIHVSDSLNSPVSRGSFTLHFSALGGQVMFERGSFTMDSAGTQASTSCTSESPIGPFPRHMTPPIITLPVPPASRSL